MKLRFWAAAVIYLASYLPLSVILLCQDLNLDRLGGGLCNPFAARAAVRCQVPLDHPIVATGAVLICALALGVALLTLRLVQPKQKIVIKESKAVPADLMNYVLPYVVSFMGLDYKDGGKLLGFGVFFLWIFVITHKSGQVILNPVLVVFGWQLYDVTYTFENETTEYSGAILSRSTLEVGKAYRQVGVQDVLIVKGEPDDHA
jgi:hypothetical protein